MQFTSLLVAAAAFIGSANAVLNLTNIAFAGTAVGKPLTITWGDAQGPVTLTLQNGDPLNLKNFEVITTGGSFPSGAFTWTPENTLPADTYTIKIEDGVSKPNYSQQFQLVGATASPSGSTASSTSTPASSSTPSSSSSTTSAPSTTPSANSSSSSTSSSASRTSSSSRSSTSQSPTTTPNNNNSATGLASPLALVLLVFAGFLALN